MKIYHRLQKTKQIMNRKIFLKRYSLSLLGLSTLPSITANAIAGVISAESFSSTRTDETSTRRIKTLTYNIFNGGIGYKGINGHELPEGKDSILVKTAREMGQIPKRIMLEVALYEPHIINFTESAKEFVVASMAKSINYNYVHFPGGKNGQGNFPGSILTPFEIVYFENRPFVNGEPENSDELFTRHWGKAIIRLPNGELITVHSAHLWPFKKEKRDTEIRLAEIEELLKSVDYDLEHNTKSVLLQGDLNQVPDTPEYRKYIEGGMFDTFEKARVKENLNTITSINPTRRIDFVLAKGKIKNQITDHRVLFEGNFRTNQDDPSSYALSDHLPVMVEFEI